MVKTQTYKLEYFKQGSYYSAESDRRRFLTLDYNMQSYIGVVGDGVIDGWDIEDIGSLQIQILPGTGLINGYFAESPYSVKLRSAMTAGDREIEVLNENDATYSPLTPAERAIYVSVIQLYDPSFNPSGDIENCYVKVVRPSTTSTLTLSDNSDNYIYAQKPTGAKPYPPLSDYPIPPGSSFPPIAMPPPNRSNYSTYDAYKIDLDVYNAQLAAVHNYEWYGSSANHFTQVTFISSASYIKSNTKVLLGKVVTRSGSITKIDTSKVEVLANLYSLIKKYAMEYLTTHRHGGSKYYDPPRIRLETDIRDAALYNYDNSTGQTTYLVVGKTETSIDLGHKHTYEVDANGNGQTYDQIGSSVSVPAYSHFHKITASVIGNPEYSLNLVEPHTHTIESASQQGDTWTDSSRFIVYVNDNVFGNETTSYIHVDADTKTIVFDKGISSSLNKYSCSFNVVLLNPYSGKSETHSYSYEARSVSVYKFMLAMELDFSSKFSAWYIEEDVLALTSDAILPSIDPSLGTTVTNTGFINENLKTHPFLLITTGGTTVSLSDFSGIAASLGDLKTQSAAAQILLQEESDAFTFTPNAARNITIVLKEKGFIDSVQIEILGNTEVTGTLRAENILFINANKILTGEFIAEVIPFISHIGRFEESCFPLQYSLVSDDGLKYVAVPTITDVNLDHYHTMLLNKSLVGTTLNVMIGNDPVYYGEDSSGKLYFISHHHGISGTVMSSSSDGLLQWQSNITNGNLTSSVHTHNVVYPVIGDNKTIYAIKEDVNGNIYAGTSDGFMIIPMSSAYLFVINGVELYFYGNDLWELLEKAGAQYEEETGNPVVITENLYGDQFDDAVEELTNDGDTVLLTAISSPDRQPDQIMIRKISSFNMPNFNYVVEKESYEILNTEKLIGTSEEGLSIVEREFNNVPIWSIESDTVRTTGPSYATASTNINLMVVGSNIVAKSVGINKTPYRPWTPISTPFSVGVTRKIIKDSSENYWVCTNNGVLVSRSHNEGNSFELTTLPGSDPDIKDIIEGELGSIYCVSSSGLFKTADGGKTWSSIYDVIGGFKQVIRDRTLDKSNTVYGHYHLLDVNIDGDGFLSESIGIGTPHVHSVSSWQIELTLGHTHCLRVTMYLVDNNGLIYRSKNSVVWSRYGEIPSSDCSELFAAFGYLFLSQQDGFYRSSDGNTWTKILDNKVYSFGWMYDLNGFYMGSDNILYESLDGLTISSIYNLNGSPACTLLDNGVSKYFGYAYSNSSQTFCFKDFRIVSGQLTALIDFAKWFSEGGVWNTSDLYDIYINYKRVLSTKFNQDKRETFGYDFDVYPANGLIDFSASSALTSDLAVYDTSVKISDTSDFVAGDKVVISSPDESLYGFLADVSSGDVTLALPSSKNIVMPATIKRIPSVNGNSSILINIYNSLLSNIGTLTHYQVEDGLSNYSDGRPYQFNDTYLSNLLQLTQATRYVYPDIDNYFINSKFYDFRYSLDPTDPFYINNYIDVSTSEIYSQNIYSNLFVGKGAKSINRILIGYGGFDDKLIVATDIGVFWANLEPTFEENWTYVGGLPYSVYDIMIFYGTTLYAATANGTYYTNDLITWTKLGSLAVNFPSYALGLRWADKGSVVASSHTANFSSNTSLNIGTIVSYSGNVYRDFEVNRGIKITDAGDKNGNYIIASISDGGTGFGSQITVSPSFAGPDETVNNVVITMGTWWEQWDGETNISNVHITNTLLLGGDSRISYNDGGTVESWTESNFGSTVSNFISRRFISLSNGRLLLSAIGKTTTNQKNYLLKSDDIGKTWSPFRTFEEVRGRIVSGQLSDFNNTILNVAYTQPANSIYVNGILDQQNISIFSSSSNFALFKGKVVWNEKRDLGHTITIFGNEAQSVVEKHPGCFFIVYPTKINTMAESEEGTLMYGTDRGLYYDVDTVINNNWPSGTIVNAGINATVSQIDISGSIVSIGRNSATGNSLLYTETNTPIRENEQTNKFLYVTDANPVEKYKIVENESEAPGNEAAIEIEDGGILTSFYIGKRFRIVGETSRVYVNFDLPVSSNQFNGGRFYILAQSNTYNNAGESYNIKSNTSSYIDLDVVLIPASSLVERVEDALTTPLLKDQLQVGQDIRLIDASGKFTIWVSLDRVVKENALAGMELLLNSSRSISGSIYSNLKNSITLTTGYITSFQKGDSFSIRGDIFEQMGGFSHLRTSIESGHYHNVETVNATVSGLIGSFGTVNSSYVDINVIDTVNFNGPIVQPTPFRGDLFEDAQIIFTNTENINLRYITEVVSYTATSIRVRVKSSSYWNFTSADPLKVSTGWAWEIDATNYGYTDGITYDDFAVLGRGVTSTVAARTNTIVVEDTSGMLVGDKISIQDDTLSHEELYVHQIISATNTIKTTTNVGRTYYLSRNPQIKVLRNAFTNTHIHQIRNNETELITVSDYLDRGYPSTHSHRVLPLIVDISVLLNNDNSVNVFGSSSIIYESTDNGQTWVELADMNDYLEGSSEVDGISEATLNTTKLIVGATNGNIFAQIS